MKLNEAGAIKKLRASHIVVYTTLTFSIFMLLYPLIYYIQKKVLPYNLHLIWYGITKYDFSPLAIPTSIWRMFDVGWDYFRIIMNKDFMYVRLQFLTTVIFLTLTISCITVWKKSKDTKVKGLAKKVSILNLLILVVSSAIAAFYIYVFSNWSP